MSSTTELLSSIQASQSGLTLAELLGLHPHVARRTAQRLIAKLVESGQVKALGEGRARRYFDQPPEARKPVGYQRDFLETYRPNHTGYLSESLRRQLQCRVQPIYLDEPAQRTGGKPAALCGRQ
jgi:predicted ArsR family transcriptional regulator